MAGSGHLVPWLERLLDTTRMPAPGADTPAVRSGGTRSPGSETRSLSARIRSGGAGVRASVGKAIGSVRSTGTGRTGATARNAARRSRATAGPGGLARTCLTTPPFRAALVAASRFGRI
jgi:hypothetical protein